MKRISKKQGIELKRRHDLKIELLLEQGYKCKECGRYLTLEYETAPNYANLSHEIPLSRGGETTKENCSVLCAEDHSNSKERHNLRNKYGENPSWSKIEL